MKPSSFYPVLLGCMLGLPLAAAAQELPLSGAAYQIADQAYRAYARGNYTQAIRDAQEAIRLRPDVERLKTLLRQAENAQRQRFLPRAGTSPAPAMRTAPDLSQVWLKKIAALQDKEQYDAALALAEQGLHSPGKQHAPLQERRLALLVLAARQAGANAVAATERGENDAALTAIRSAVAYQPEVPQYRLLLIKLLIERKDYSGAAGAAAQALSIDSDDAMAQSFAAYLLQQRGERAAAAARYAQTLNSDALGDQDLRNLRLIAADAALAAGDAPAALSALLPLPEKDPDVQERRRLASAIGDAGSTFRPALTAPALRCIVNRFGPVCSLFPAGRPSQTLAAGAYRASSEQRLPEALALLDEALRIGGENRELSAQKEATRRLMARQPAAAAYQALADNNPVLAQQEIGKAIAFAPDMMAYRLALIETLERQKQYAQAESAANEAIAIDDEDVAPLVLRGYLRQLQGNFGAARGDYLTALKSDTLSDTDRRELRLFIADAALAGGDTALAGDTLAALPAGDPQGGWRQLLAASAGRDQASRPRLLAPTLDCRLTPYGTVCSVKPSVFAGNALIVAIYRALGRNDPQQASALARQLLALAPDNENYQRILAQALSGAGQPEEAAKITAGLRKPVPDLEFAYLALVANAPDLATQTFRQIDAAGQLPPRALQDAGFAAINANQRPAATGYFKRAIDASADGGLKLAPQQLFDTRRTVSELEREWGGYVALNYRGSNPQSGPLNPATPGDSLQLGAEGYWRPASLNKNGRYVDLYARLSGSAYSSEDSIVTGAASLQGALGVRVKPLASQNLILAFERLVPLGSAAQGDWLARAGYSYGKGTDLRVDVPSWYTGQVFAEAGRYLQAGTSYFTSEGQIGRSYMMPQSWPKNTVLTPHLVLGADYNQGFVRPEAVGAGIGLSLRHWFREDRYHAPRSYFDVTVQYRVKLAGDERAGGLVVRAILNY